MLAPEVISEAQRLLAKGETYARIADVLKISKGTVFRIKDGQLPPPPGARGPGRPRRKGRKNRVRVRDGGEKSLASVQVEPYRCVCGNVVVYDPCKICGAHRHAVS